MTINATAANFAPVDAGILYVRNGASFYQLTPAKGARVDGTISVAVSAHETQRPGATSHYDKINAPAMWIDYTPNHADGNGRQLLSVNGKEYGAGFAGSISGNVEFIPASEHNGHLANHYLSVTVDGADYYVSGRFNMFDKVSDKAREVLNATVEAIAAEYVTSERWHAYKVARAQDAVKRQAGAVAEAQAELEKAQARLGELQR